MPPRAWSLTAELATLANAVEAARVLADDASVPPDSTRDPTATALALAGVLALVAARLRDLGRVVRGEIDPASLRAPHNAVEARAVSDTGDTIFRAWGPRRRLGHARTEIARAEAALARARR